MMLHIADLFAKLPRPGAVCRELTSPFLIHALVSSLQYIQS